MSFGCLLLQIILTGLLTASDLPRKAPDSRYRPLWDNSPFTSRPVAVEIEDVPEENPLEEFSLIGVSPSTDGFRVTLINRNDPSERIIVDSGRKNPNHDFKVLEIDRKPGLPLATTVKLSKGNSIGTVSFEPEMLTLAPPPVPNRGQEAAQAGGAPPQPAQAGDDRGARRQPRPRVVPPAQGNPPAQGQRAPNTQGATRGINPQGARGQNFNPQRTFQQRGGRDRRPTR